MAEMSVISRKPTADELKNYTPIGFQTLEKKFKLKRVDVEQEYVKKHKPFCARCADLDFADMWANKKKELERQVGRGNQEVHTTITFDFPDLEEYGKEGRFEFIKKTPIMREVIIDGVRVPKLVGHYYEYKCKVRNCGHSVEMPLVDLAQELPATTEKKSIR